MQERGIAAAQALKRLAAQQFNAIDVAGDPPAYRWAQLHVHPGEYNGAPGYAVDALTGSAPAIALDNLWRIFDAIRVFRQLGTAQLVALHTNMFAGVLVGMPWEEALDTALADALADQLQVLTGDEQQIIEAYIDHAENAEQCATAVNAYLADLQTPRRLALRGALQEGERQRSATRQATIARDETPLSAEQIARSSLVAHRLRSVLIVCSGGDSAISSASEGYNMGAVTPREREAFHVMQGRLVELLLRYDAPRFGKTFAEQVAEGFDDPRLRRYRELAVLFYLREELFASIIPRIKRRLSFVAPREVHVESLPPRGRIDWSRTLSTSLHNHPGEPPLEVQTRQRRRTSRPQTNLLAVVTLLEYRAAVQRVLDTEATQDRVQALRHPLQEIIGACTRELVFPQFAGLERAASEIIEGRAGATPSELERQVARGLVPGRNSAYDDLLAWRRRLQQLTLGQRDAPAVHTTAFGADPDADNRLYQLWIFFELADLLRTEGCCGPEDLVLRPLRLRFQWGDAAMRFTTTRLCRSRLRPGASSGETCVGCRGYAQTSISGEPTHREPPSATGIWKYGASRE
ncbi:MAG: hypothetical protein HC828_07365 [Blastochloris sp.]|nr:hypothetical protein [Blastochloris sp.]